MKIRYISPSPKVGQVEHIRNDAGITLIAAGFAEAVPYKDFRERLREEGQPTPDPNVGKTEWGVLGPNTQFREVTVVKKVVGGETTYFSAPPPDAPKSIVKQFEDLSNSTGSTAAADFEAAKRAQLEYNERLKDIPRW